MLNYLAEFIGTFVFLSIILATGKPIPIAVGLLAAIYLMGGISGGHFNPAVSVMMYLNKSLKMNDLPLYIAAQVGGGVLAYYWKVVSK